MMSGKLTLFRRCIDSVMNKIIFMLAVASALAALIYFLIAKFWMKMTFAEIVNFTFSFYNSL